MLSYCTINLEFGHMHAVIGFPACAKRSITQAQLDIQIYMDNHPDNFISPRVPVWDDTAVITG